MANEFVYEKAFDRNIGWVTEWEQAALRAKRVAIAGMGGVGGVHLITLTRLGIGAFNIADLDTFDIANFNRQIGATMDTIGRPKLDVMAEMALAINPELRLERFPQGVTADNVDDFLSGVDLFVDGFDFFVLDIRRRVFARCAELGIPAVTAAPIGMGTGFLAFMPGGMTFEQYFRLEGQSQNEQYLRFLMGVAPRGLHRAYLVDPSRIDLAAKRGPSTGAACQLCSGVVTVAAVKILLRRGDVKPAPYHHHFDPYLNRLALTRLRFGNAGPLQRAKLALARRMYSRAASATPANASSGELPTSELMQILNIARWAPSGDNTQPWRFESVDDETVIVHLNTEAGINPYDYRGGEPSLLSGGMLLENIRIAATSRARGMDWSFEGGEGPYRIRVRLPHCEGVKVDPLLASVTTRSVDRGSFRSRPLTPAEKARLESSLGPSLSLRWYEDAGARWRLAKLGAKATDIRLRAPETYAVHREMLDWTRRHSPTGIPASAIGLDRASLRVMRWAMQRWDRVARLNRVMGTRATSFQLDLRPGLGSAAFFAIQGHRPNEPNERIPMLLQAGQDVQRFWLTATHLGLSIQPGFASLIFSYYGAEDFPFTEDAALRLKSKELAKMFMEVTGVRPQDVLFLGRIGQPRSQSPRARSVRRPLSELMMWKDADPAP
ncbi:ThiF family adenylyltransferase [Muricoccus radiodurans]|uniref:ThiF family adenylyltransferase n=1 Tax=Muricoccus radiodurans TaxID=2231721 RepID=UPI003CE83B13